MKTVIEQKKHTGFELERYKNGDVGVRTIVALFTLEQEFCTEVAKAIDPNYQKVVDENLSILKYIEYGNKQIDFFQKQIEKIRADESINEETRFSQLRLTQGKFYGWRDSIKILIQSLDQDK